MWILDILRKKIGKPVIVNSGYRTPEHNKKVGGAKYSYHMRGMAADIRVNGMSPKELGKAVKESKQNQVFQNLEKTHTQEVKQWGAISR